MMRQSHYIEIAIIVALCILIIIAFTSLCIYIRRRYCAIQDNDSYNKLLSDSEESEDSVIYEIYSIDNEVISLSFLGAEVSNVRTENEHVSDCGDNQLLLQDIKYEALKQEDVESDQGKHSHVIQEEVKERKDDNYDDSLNNITENDDISLNKDNNPDNNENKNKEVTLNVILEECDIPKHNETSCNDWQITVANNIEKQILEYKEKGHITTSTSNPDILLSGMTVVHTALGNTITPIPEKKSCMNFDELNKIETLKKQEIETAIMSLYREFYTIKNISFSEDEIRKALKKISWNIVKKGYKKVVGHSKNNAHKREIIYYKYEEIDKINEERKKIIIHAAIHKVFDRLISRLNHENFSFFLRVIVEACSAWVSYDYMTLSMQKVLSGQKLEDALKIVRKISDKAHEQRKICKDTTQDGYSNVMCEQYKNLLNQKREGCGSTFAPNSVSMLFKEKFKDTLFDNHLHPLSPLEEVLKIGNYNLIQGIPVMYNDNNLLLYMEETIMGDNDIEIPAIRTIAYARTNTHNVSSQVYENNKYPNLLSNVPVNVLMLDLLNCREVLLILSFVIKNVPNEKERAQYLEQYKSLFHCIISSHMHMISNILLNVVTVLKIQHTREEIAENGLHTLSIENLLEKNCCILSPEEIENCDSDEIKMNDSSVLLLMNIGSIAVLLKNKMHNVMNMFPENYFQDLWDARLFTQFTQDNIPSKKNMMSQQFSKILNVSPDITIGEFWDNYCPNECFDLEDSVLLDGQNSDDNLREKKKNHCCFQELEALYEDISYAFSIFAHFDMVKMPLDIPETLIEQYSGMHYTVHNSQWLFGK